MLEQLTEICSAVILRHVTLTNCTAILADTSPIYSPKLKACIHKYIAVNIECLLERRYLDDMAYHTMKELSAFVRDQQAMKLPHTRSGAWIATLMEKHKEWLKLQDFPTVVVRAVPPGRQPKTSPKLSPTSPTSPKTPRRISSFNLPLTPQKVNTPKPSDKPTQYDGMFVMDEERVEAAHGIESPAKAGPSLATPPELPTSISSPATHSAQVWKRLGAAKPE
jgi:hypothetical protein